MWVKLHWTDSSKFNDPNERTSGVARLSAARADHKSAALSTPQVCFQKFKMKEDYVSYI